MRIGFDAKRAFHNARGLGNYSRDLIRIMVHEFPENDYLLFNSKKTSSALLDCPQGCLEITPNTFLDKQCPSYWRSFRIPIEYERLQLDIFHGLSNEIPYSFGSGSTRTVLTLHDLIFVKYPHLYPITDRILYKKKYLGSCKRADKIIAISNQTKSDLLELTDIEEQKITVIHQGCNPIFHQKVSEEQRQYVKEKYRLPDYFILNVGAIEERKNQQLILEAVHQQRLEIPLVVVGRPVGDWMQQLQKRVSNYRMESQVQFLNEVPTEDLPALYSLSSLFVYPSLYEGFGIPILEALNSGIPVISSKGSCLEEAGGPNSMYVNSSDAEELGFAIQKCLSDTMQREAMIQDGYRHAANFSDSSIATKLMNVYSSL